jgi:tetratricopeptide (TPR) repeat protein
MSGQIQSLDKSLCACGSGLRRVRCCGFDAAAGPDPAHYMAMEALAETMLAARTAGRNREAERHALVLLDLAPLHRHALRILFEIRRDEGRAAGAEALIRRLAALDPPSAQFHFLHAQLLIGQGRHAEAEAPARSALMLAPRDAAAHHLTGIVFTETGRLLPGEQHYRLALGLLDAPDVTILGNLAWNLKLQGRLAEAASLYDTVLKLRPGVLRSLAGAAQVHAALGDLGRAEALLAEASRHAPANRAIGLLEALLHLRRRNAAGALARLEKAGESGMPLSAGELAAKGQALESLERPQEAFAVYRAGRDIQQQRHFDVASLEAKAEALRGAYMADRLAALPRPKHGGTYPVGGQPAPIFLLGVRRSGTSLLEQLLCMTSGIDPADERSPLNDLVKLLPKLVAGVSGVDRPYPAALAETIAGEARDVLPMLAARYFALLRGAGAITAGTHHVTDRSPDLVWTLGLAGLLFPDAPVIHVLRHPLDVVLSGFAQDRLYEGNAGVTLDSLARLYDIQMSMIGHFRGQMTLRYLPVRYENLVTGPAAVLAQIFSFAGITADPLEVLAKPPRPLLRAPTHQILREPPHRRSLYRHRRFGPVFSEIMPLLAPWIERLGYDQPAAQSASAQSASIMAA